MYIERERGKKEMYIHLTGEANYGCPHTQTGRGYPSSRGPPTVVLFSRLLHFTGDDCRRLDVVL